MLMLPSGVLINGVDFGLYYTFHLISLPQVSPLKVPKFQSPNISLPLEAIAIASPTRIGHLPGHRAVSEKHNIEAQHLLTQKHKTKPDTWRGTKRLRSETGVESHSMIDLQALSNDLRVVSAQTINVTLLVALAMPLSGLDPSPRDTDVEASADRCFRMRSPMTAPETVQSLSVLRQAAPGRPYSGSEGVSEIKLKVLREGRSRVFQSHTEYLLPRNAELTNQLLRTVSRFPGLCWHSPPPGIEPMEDNAEHSEAWLGGIDAATRPDPYYQVRTVAYETFSPNPNR